MTSTMGVLLDRAGVELPLSDLANLWPLGGWNSVAPVPGGKNEHLRVAAGEGVHYLRRSYRSANTWNSSSAPARLNDR